jgi:hypothetical protein
MEEGFNGFCTRCKQPDIVPNEVVQKPFNHRGKPGGDIFIASERLSYVTSSILLRARLDCL